MKKFKFVNVVWGAKFTEAFLKYSLPSLLLPGNLPEFSKKTKSDYKIYTTKKDLDIILCSEAYNRLAEIMPVEICLIKGLDKITKYDVMNQCHINFLKSIINEECSIIIQSPDVIWSENSFSTLLSLYDKGKKNVMIGSVRLNKETFIEALDKRFGSELAMRRFNSRELLEVALSHLHPETRNKFFNNPGFGQGELIWPVGDRGLLVRHYRLQPILITPHNKNYFPKISYDDDYAENVVSNIDDWHIVQDSDEMCYVDFTSFRERQEGAKIKRIFSITEEAKWVNQYTTKFHKEFVKHSIYLHIDSISQDWLKAELESQALVESIIKESSFIKADQIEKQSNLRYLNPFFYIQKFYLLGFEEFVFKIRNRLMKSERNSLKFEKYNY